MINYTTADTIAKITDEKEKTEEQKKTILSNDAYAVVDLLEKLSKQLEVNRISSL